MKNRKPTPVKHAPGYYLNEWCGSLHEEPPIMITQSALEQPLLYRCFMNRIEEKSEGSARAIRASFALLLLFCQQNQKMPPTTISEERFHKTKMKIADLVDYMLHESDFIARMRALKVLRPAFKNEILIADFFIWYEACVLQSESAAWRRDFLSDWLSLLICYEAMPGHEPFGVFLDID